jgi:agmatinase
VTARSLEDPPPADAGLFGVDLDLKQNQVVIVGVPWEPTASYGRGTSATPRAIVAASHQLDFYDPFTGREIAREIGMLPVDTVWEARNRECIALADQVHAGWIDSASRTAAREKVNAASAQLNQELEALTTELLAKGKTVGVLGGDHSAPFGAIRAIHRLHPKMGILHIDAHHDLREAYEGFTFSHASIMYNVLHHIDAAIRLVSVGIRDFSKSEHVLAASRDNLITFYDHQLRDAHLSGETWSAQCKRIVESLPGEVYISFDIDGLDPKLCPNTGTPVPGGLDYGRAVYLLEELVRSGRSVVGFDLCEVSPGPGDPPSEWDLNVGARVLHRLCCLAVI